MYIPFWMLSSFLNPTWNPMNFFAAMTWGQLIPWPELHAMQALSSQIWGGRFLRIQVFLYGEKTRKKYGNVMGISMVMIYI